MSYYGRRICMTMAALLGVLLFLLILAPDAWAASPEYEQEEGESEISSEPEHDDLKTTRHPRTVAYDGVYVVQSGDTLSELAVRFGTTVRRLARHNDIADPDLIYIGQEIHFQLRVAPAASEASEGETEEAMEEEEGEERERPDEPDEAAELRFLQESNEEGKIPENALVEAEVHAERMQEEPLPGAAIPATTGDNAPAAAGINQRSWTSLGPGNVGGRVRSVVVHPTNPQTMWAGSVGGGIWKTTDGGASWRPLNDFMANLAVSTMAIDPTNPDVLYAGTGEDFLNLDQLSGAGIFKTTDGGTNWTQLPSTAGSNFRSINRLAISPTNNQVLLAATSNGIYRSTDGGGNWTFVDGNLGIKQVAFNPNNGNLAVASGSNGKLLYSTDGGVHWTPATGVSTSSDSNKRVEIAYAPSNPNIVYASVNEGRRATDGITYYGLIYKSTDGGHSYTQASQFLYGYFGNNRFGGDGQGWYDNAIWVSPTNSNTLIVGGIDLWRSTDGGATLTKISDWNCGGLEWSIRDNCGGPTSAHADQHIIVSHPGYNGTTNRTVFFGNDGGVYKAQDATTVQQLSGWQELNNNFGVTQFYGGAGNITSGKIVGGTQDNGDLNYTGNPEAWRLMGGGDGGFSAADPTNSNYFYGEYVRLQIRRSTDGGASTSSIHNGIGDAGGNALFIAPFILDPNNPNTMLAGGRSLWRSTNVKASTPSWASIRGPIQDSEGNPLEISAISVAPGNSNIIFVGYVNGLVYKTTNGTSTSPTWTRVDSQAMPGRFTTRITVSPSNSNVVYATFGGFETDNVWRTADGGSTWTEITGSGQTGLPNAPVRSLVVHPNNPSWLYVGTEVGVFASENGGANWSVPTDGPANVSVDELFWMGTRLVAATHGRGMFEADTNAPQRPVNDDFANAQTLTGNTATANGTNAGATKETGEPNHAGEVGGKSVWYKWTPQSSGTVNMNTRGSTFDTLLAVYTGSAVNGLTQVAANDDEDNANGIRTSKLLPFQANAGTTYRIAVDGWNAENGNITLNLAQNAPPPDTTPPGVTLTAPAEGAVVSGTSVTLSADASDNVGVKQVDFVRQDNGLVIGTDTTSPYSISWNSTNVQDGRRSLRAVAEDAAGNTASTQPREIIVDNTRPDTSITAGPSGIGNTTTATFEFASSELDSTFRCSLDNAAFGVCTTPKTYNSLSVGEHTFQVKAVGAGGEANDSDSTPASRTWTVSATPDTTAPSVSLTGPVDGEPVGGASVTLSADAADNVAVQRVEFLVDGSAVGTDTTAPYAINWDSTTITNTTGDGFVSLAARASDAAGNSTTSASRRIAVDNTFPQTEITAGPAGTGNGATARFEFRSTNERDVTFRCKLDNEPNVTQCSSPKDYGNLGDGKHTFSVHAVGAGGEANDSDTTPAVRTWDVGAPQVNLQTYQEHDLDHAGYSGWFFYGDPNLSAGRSAYATSAGNTATFTFRGTSIVWKTATFPNSGRTDVFLDGRFRKSFDAYSGGPRYNVTGFAKSNMVKKRHTIKLILTGKKNASSSGIFNDIDRFVVGRKTYQENSPRVVYGSWKGAANLSASGGTYRVGGASNSAYFLTFSGPQIDLITARGPSYGTATVQIREAATDALAKTVTLDLNAPTVRWQAVQSITGLDPGKEYYLRIFSADSRPVVIDAYRAVTQGAPSPAISDENVGSKFKPPPGMADGG